MDKFLIEWKKFLIETEFPRGPRKIKFHRTLGQPDVLAPESPSPADSETIVNLKKSLKKLKGDEAIEKFIPEYLQLIDKLKKLGQPPISTVGYRAKGKGVPDGKMIKWPGSRIDMNVGLVAALQAIRRKAERDVPRGGLNMAWDGSLFMPCSGFRSLTYEKKLWNDNLAIYANRVNQVFDDLRTITSDKELKSYCGGGHHKALSSTIERMNHKFGFCKSLNAANAVGRKNRRYVSQVVTRGFKAYPPGPHTTGRAVDISLGLARNKCTNSNYRSEMYATVGYQWFLRHASMFGLSPYGGKREGGEPWHWEIHPSNANWALKTFGLEGKRTELQQMAVDTWPEQDAEEILKVLDAAAPSSLDPKKFPVVCKARPSLCRPKKKEE